jgi:hypothetical protein
MIPVEVFEVAEVSGRELAGAAVPVPVVAVVPALTAP